MFGLHWELYGFSGVVISQTLAFIPLAYMMIESTMMSLNPNLEESAYDMGASEATILRTITIPLMAPGLLKAALLIFVMTIAEFGNAAILGGRTPFLAPDTYTMITGESDFNMGSVLSVVLIAPCIIIFFIHNYLLEGKKFTTIGGKPVASEPRKITPLIKIPFVIITTIAAGAILICFAVVIAASFYKILGVTNKFILANYLDFTSNQAIYNSIRVSFVAAVIGAVIGVLLAYVIVRGKFFGRTFIEMASLSGFALPGTVLGIGYLLAFSAPPLKLTGRHHDPRAQLRLPVSRRRRGGGDQQAPSDPYRDRRGLRRSGGEFPDHLLQDRFADHVPRLHRGFHLHLHDGDRLLERRCLPGQPGIPTGGGEDLRRRRLWRDRHRLGHDHKTDPDRRALYGGTELHHEKNPAGQRHDQACGMTRKGDA